MFLDLVKQVQAIAHAGLSYAENSYDRERYEALQDVARRMWAEVSDAPPARIAALFDEPPGYPTPKVDVRAVVMRGGRVLMIRERADGRWALPGGWADVGYTPRETAEKETWEEATVRVRAERLLAVFDKRCHPHPPAPHYAYKLFVACVALDDAAPRAGSETLAADFFAPDALPPLSEERNTASQIATALDLLADPNAPTVFD
ncbi:MAG: NUDIX hydrolase [Catalinimonas sp.]